MEEIKSEENETRQEEIVKWLAISELAIKLKKGEGFFVPKGPHVELSDGSDIDLLDWLYEEGITGDKTIAGYSIVYKGPESEFGEKISFLKIKIDIVKAPFYPKSNISDDSSKIDDDNIPF